MPHRERRIPWPLWVERIGSECLQTTVKEALHARDAAVDGGAERHTACARVLRAADATLDQIEFDRVTGRLACRKAADALRKFNTAAECAHPTARI